MAYARILLHNAASIRTPYLLSSSIRSFRSSALMSSSSSSVPSLHISNLNPKVLSAQYAVRGELVQRADEIRQHMSNKSKTYPFTKVISCNIGNPQELGQPPLTFHRTVLSLLQSPFLMDNHEIVKSLPADTVQRARSYLSSFSGMGAYSASQGLKFIREEVAAFIAARDGYPSKAEDIFLADGASSAVKLVCNLILSSPKDGLMIPIPQYPLYTATIALMGGSRIDYLLHEDKGWSLTIDDLEEAARRARSQGITPRGLVVINPGNPTGQCLSREIMREIVKFAQKNNILLLADEVYQCNVYNPSSSFHSFKSVCSELKSSVQLVSFHSTSKGFLGECGQRGGYMELHNIDEAVRGQILKMSSISLCSNTSGQMMTGLMVNPPKQGDPSHKQYCEERDAILQSLKRRATKLESTFNSLPNLRCNSVDGALYAFPTVVLPQSFIEHAKKVNKVPDALYCLELLESTGICVVPGSGFGQKDGTWHFRTTILPAEKDFDEVMGRYKEFHIQFIGKWEKK